MTATLITICVILSAFLCISLAFNIKHAKIIIDVEDALEEALDVCDVAYGKMTDVMQLPVAMNTPEVKHVLTSIENVRDSVLYVSNVLAAPYGGVNEEEIDDA